MPRVDVEENVKQLWFDQMNRYIEGRFSKSRMI